MIFSPYFVLLTSSILFSFTLYHFYLLSKPQTCTSSFFAFFFNNNPKVALLLPPLIYLFSILVAIFFGYYCLIIISLLFLLNFWLKSPYLVYLAHFFVLVRLLWFFAPFEEIFLMTSPFRSFACVFSFVSYVFFTYHHKIVLLWIGSFLRVLVGVSIGDMGIVYGGLGVIIENKPPLPKPSVVPQMFFDTISKHQHAAIVHEIKSFQKPPVIFKNNILAPWERVYFGDKTPITASEQTYFLKYGPHSRLFSNYEVLAKAIGIDKLIVSHEDYYATVHMEHSEDLHLVYPIKNLVEFDWVAAQANEEFIAAKAAALKYFPSEQVTIARGYKSIDFVLTGESGKKLYLDVASLSDETINDMDFSVLDYKLKKLPNISGYENAAKVLLYNYAWNSKTFLEASKLDGRILTVENTYIQKLFDLCNLKVDFLKSTPKPTGEFIFRQTPVVETYALPREKAIKSIVYLKK